MPYAVFTIHPSGKVDKVLQEKAPKLDQLQAAVQGYIETVPYFTKMTLDGTQYKHCTAYANEEGLLRGMQMNLLASLLWRESYPHTSQLLHGLVVIYCKIKETQS